MTVYDERIDNLLSQLVTSNTDKVVDTIRSLRIILSEPNPPIKAIVEAGWIPMLARYSKSEQDPKLILEAFWCLTNISAEDDAYVMEMWNNEVISVAIEWLDAKKNRGVFHQAMWLLANCAAESKEVKVEVKNLGGIRRLLFVLDHCVSKNGKIVDVPSFRLAAWCSASFTKKNPAVSDAEISMIFKAILVGLDSSDETTVEYVLDTLAYASEKTEHISIIVDGGYLPNLVKRCASSSSIDVFVTRSVRILGNVASGTVDHSKALDKSNFLPECLKLLQKGFNHREMLWILSNFAVNGEKFSRKLFKHELDTIISFVYPSADKGVVKELAWLFIALLEYRSTRLKLSKYAKDILRVITEIPSDEQSILINKLKCNQAEVFDNYLNNINPEDKEDLGEILESLESIVNPKVDPTPVVSYVKKYLSVQ